MLLDMVFWAENFLNEIVWQRTAVKGDVHRKYGAVHDIILTYTRTSAYLYHSLFTGVNEESYKARFKFDDSDGRGPYQSAPLDSPNPRPNLTYEYKGYQPPEKGWRVNRELMARLDHEGKLIFPTVPSGRIRRKVYLNEQQGPKVTDVWVDISPLQGGAIERLGYPTQKPLSLLERIIQSSSNPGDVVLDPFCGCGTAIAAAQKLGRKWIGIDITHLAISLIKRRMEDAYGDDLEYEVIGEPTTVEGARELAEVDKYQFQWWALGLVGARPADQKKGSDHGIDGRLYFHDDSTGKTKQVILSVKGGHTNVAHVRDLVGVLEREKAEMGVLISLEEATKPMRAEAASAGFYESPWGKHPRVQVLTIEELLAGQGIDMPPIKQVNQTFKKTPRQKKDSPGQMGLLGE
jgi:hypothetical protein